MLARLSAALPLVAAALAAQESPFSDPLVITLGHGPRQLSGGDLDGDGRPDVVATLSDGSLTVTVNLGGGAFAPPTDVFSLPGTNRTTLADVDADGDLDLLACIDGPNYEYVTTRRGNGDGTFATNSVFYPVNAGPQDFEVGDVDSDGAPDVLVACQASARLSLLMGQGDGLFDAAVDVPVGVNGRGVALGRLDAGDELDAVAVTTGGLLIPLTGDGAGGFTAGPTQLIPTTARDVDLGDVDGDGDDDALMTLTDFEARLALCQGDGTFAPATSHPLDSAAYRPTLIDLTEDGLADAVLDPLGVTCFESLGGGALGPPARFGVVHGTWDMLVADLTGDGDLDVLASEFTFLGNGLGVLLKGDGDGGFGPILQTGDGPRDVAAGDVDGDGRIDLVVAAEFDDTLRVHRGLPHGSFSGTADTFAGGEGPNAVALGDVDEDGTLDAVVANTTATGTVSVLLGLGGGALGAPQPIGVGATPADLVLADFDGDVHLDLAVSCSNLTLVVLHGDGTGSFALAQTLATAAAFPQSIAAALLDGDDLLDLLAANTTGVVNVYLGLPGGTFADPLSFPGHFDFPGSLATGDVDGDGDVDALTASDGGGSLFFNDGAGFLTLAPTPLALASATRVALADVTRDEVLDIVGASEDSIDIGLDVGGLSVLAGQGDGSFGPPVTVFTSPLAQALIAQDLDGDGAADVAIATVDDDVCVRLNTLGPWDDLGLPLAGSKGLPRQFASGSLQPGSPVAISLADALPGGVASQVVGLSAMFAPFKGGTYVPTPTLVVFPLPLDGQGDVTLTGTWPGPPAPGLQFWSQFWAADPAAVKGWSASNALRATLP